MYLRVPDIITKPEGCHPLSGLLIYRDNYMSRMKPLPEFINDFKIITDLGRHGNNRFADVECPICKTISKKRIDALKKVESCGCKFFTPGVSRRLQRIYNGMKGRCNRPSHIHFMRYGGAGIKLCNEWGASSKSFYKWALSNNYEDNLTIDRIDNLQGYSPKNCRWVTQLDNSRNRLNTIVTKEMATLIKSEGNRIPLDLLATKYGIAKSTLKAVKYNQNWKDV